MKLVNADSAKALWVGDHPIAVMMRNIFDDLPAVDAEPVRHGQWMYGETNNPFITEIYCPWCGKPTLYPEDEDRPLETEYCPHCGAKMDAERVDPAWPFYEASLKMMNK